MATRAFFYSFVNFLNLNFFECVCKEILTEDFLGEQNLLSSSDESGTDTADQMNGPSDPALFIGMRSRDHKKLARKPSLLSAIAAALAVPQRET